MDSLKDIKRRIKAVQSTRKITRAMKLVASAKLRPSQRAAMNGRSYAVELHRTIQRISRRLGPRAPMMWRRPQRLDAMDVLVITSDRGFCGGFNENLLHRVEEGICELESHNISVKIYCIGRKGWEYMRYRGYDVERVPGGSDKRVVRWSINAMMLRFLYGESAGGYVAFNRFVSASHHEIAYWNLLPLYTHGEEVEKQFEYIFEPERDMALDFIASEYLVSTVRQAIYESRASELASRIMAMSGATKNADEMIKHLVSLCNRARQEAITEELMDIVGGAEALRKVS